MSSKTSWIPEIVYEDAEEGISSIPFVMVPAEEEMPTLLYIFESRQTGEFEPGLDGEEVPVVQWDLHQYADMMILKERLDTDTYDTIRVALGLDPLEDAVKKGQGITQDVRNNLSI